MKVNEIFESIQGEGLYTGARTTFVRFEGCSVRCSWCDTKYAWAETGEYVPVETLALRIAALQPRIACLTGGEPLEQDQGALGKLITGLDSYGLECHIETSGTVPVTDNSIIEKVALWSISPKMSNASPKIKADPELVARLMFNIAGAGMNSGQLKFVVKTNEDFKEVRDYLIRLCEDPEGEVYCPWPVVLQPLAEPPLDYESYFEHLVYIKETADEWLYDFDVRVMPQLHYLMWKGRKGI